MDDNDKKSTAFSGIVCITTLLKHMIMTTKKCYANTEHENTYMIYHDALTQLMHNKTVDWMRTTKIPGEDTVVYKQWIKPENGKGRPIGNSPEVMPLDTCLFQDVKESV